MLGKLARMIVAFGTFPLLGAYGWRWLGAFISASFSAGQSRLQVSGVPLDWAGALIGLLLGLVWAMMLFGCVIQPESSPVRAPADLLLILLGLLFWGDIAALRYAAEASWLAWLPAANLLLWVGAAAATLSLRSWRRWLEKEARGQAAWQASEAVMPLPQETDRPRWG